jgi:hypothetical protein
LYEICAEFKVRSEATADDSLAAMRERRKLGTATAAMIRMMATTINSSMSENPLLVRIASSSFRFGPTGLFKNNCCTLAAAVGSVLTKSKSFGMQRECAAESLARLFSLVKGHRK